MSRSFGADFEVHRPVFQQSAWVSWGDLGKAYKTDQRCLVYSLFSLFPLCVFASWREIPSPHDIHSETFPFTHSASVTVHVSCFGDPLRPDALSPSWAQRIVATVNFARPLSELRGGRSDR